MSNKIEQQAVTGFDNLFGTSRKAEPINIAIMFISDEGSSGKSTAAIAFTTVLRKVKREVDLWLCDADHISPMEMFGAWRSGELLPFDQQMPDGCGFFNIRTDGAKLIDNLKSPVRYKIFDMPAASIDELPQLFDSVPSFLQAFEATRTKLIIAVPFNNDGKSLLSAQKLRRMFSGVNHNVDLEFLFIFNHSLMSHEDKTLHAYSNDSDIALLKKHHVVHEGHIKTKITSRFNTVIDYNDSKASNNWFDIYNSEELALHDQITMEGFLKEYTAIVRATLSL